MRSAFVPGIVLAVAFLSPLAGAQAWQAADQPELQRLVLNAPALKTLDVCQPVKTTRPGLLLWAPNPDGKSWDILQIYFMQYGGPNTIVICDLGSGEVKQVQIPAQPNHYNFHLCGSAFANGKLYLLILAQGLKEKICIYDPATNEFKLDALPMPADVLGETHPLVKGTDGKLYAIGQHASKAATAVVIDPATDQLTPLGPIGPSHAPDACWGYSGGADDRFVYIASGKIPWYLVAYDKQTGQSQALLTTEKVGGYVNVYQHANGCSAFADKVIGTDGTRQEYWLHQGRAISKKEMPTAPWKETRTVAGPALPPKPEVSNVFVNPDEEGWCEILVRSAADAARAPKNPPPDARPEDLGWKRIRYQVPIYAERIYRLMELPDGRLFGTAGSYGGNFIYDPKTGQGGNLGKCLLSHYATAIADGKIYMSGYPSAPVYVYDPAKPWTALTPDGMKQLRDDNKRSNPRQVGCMKESGAHKMYAACVGADGKIYFGGRWMRDGACGGLGWYDPKTEKIGGMWKEFSNLQISHMAAAQEGRTLVISTLAVRDALLGKPTPAQGALVLFDVMKGEIVGKIEPVPKARGAGSILAVGANRIVGWTENPDAGEKRDSSLLYGVDLGTRQVAWTKTLPFPPAMPIGSNQQENTDFRLGPDGNIWAFIGIALVRINPATAEVSVLGRINPAGRIAFSGNDLYIGGTPFIRKVQGVAVR